MIVTCAPETTAPCWSVTVPVIVPVYFCAKSGAQMNKDKRKGNTTNEVLRMASPPACKTFLLVLKLGPASTTPESLAGREFSHKTSCAMLYSRLIAMVKQKMWGNEKSAPVIKPRSGRRRKPEFVAKREWWNDSIAEFVDFNNQARQDRYC